jgi:hypothetical protein
VQRNMIWTYVRNMPGPYLWVYLPAHILVNIVSFCWFVYCCRWRVVWQAKRDALKVLPEIWRERRAIQACSRIAPQQVLEVMEHGTILSSIIPKIIHRLRDRLGFQRT